MFSWIGEVAGKVPGWVLIALTFFIGGGAGALIQALRDVAIRWLDHSYEDDDEEDTPQCLRPIEVLHDSHEMYSALEALCSDTDADRVLLYRQENGGELPTVGQTLTSSIDLEVLRTSVPSVQEEWQKQKLDQAYVRMLVEVDESDGVSVLGSSARGILQDYMQRRGLGAIYFFSVFSTPGAFFYLSIEYLTTTTTRPPISMPAYRDGVRVCTAKLSTILTRWYTGIAR